MNRHHRELLNRRRRRLDYIEELTRRIESAGSEVERWSLTNLRQFVIEALPHPQPARQCGSHLVTALVVALSALSFFALL